MSIHFEAGYNLLMTYGVRWALLVALIVASIVVGFLVSKITRAVLMKMARATKMQADDIVAAAIPSHVVFWFFLAGAMLALKLFPAILSPLISVGPKVIFAGFIISITLFVAKVVTQLFATYGARVSQNLPLTSLTENVIKIVIIGIGIMIVMSNLGISITPLITALGVGSLAVALALQDTLSNLFAGFHIIGTGQIRTGDYIKLESGEMGYVVDIGWRSTRIRELPNNVVIIPNATIASSIVKNFYYPEKEMAVLVQVGVSYSSDLEQVEKVTVDAGREIMQKIEGCVPTFEPFIRYHTFNNSSIDFTVILRAKEVVDQYIIKHEFIKLLHKRYNEHNIEIPFPQRVVHMPK